MIFAFPPTSPNLVKKRAEKGEVGASQAAKALDHTITQYS